MKPAKLTRGAVSLTAALTLTAGVVLALPSVATAQPNPFDAYEGKKQTEDTKSSNAGNNTSQDCDCEAKVQTGPKFTNQSVTRKKDFLVGATSSMSFTTSYNETDADPISNSTLFIRLAPNFGYFLMDNLEVGGSVGLLWRQIARSDETNAVGRDLTFQARGRYHFHVTERFSLLPGLALGGYVGRSQRSTQALQDGMLETIDYDTRTFGLIAEGGVEIGYLLTPDLQLQAGLNAIGLFGGERSQLEQETFQVRTFNTSLSIGLAKYF
jgi:hypothetical protein